MESSQDYLQSEFLLIHRISTATTIYLLIVSTVWIVFSVFKTEESATSRVCILSPMSD